MDVIWSSWVDENTKAAHALAAASDRFDFEVLDPQRHIARFHCRGLVQRPGGEIAEADEFAVGISIGDDYLRHVDPLRVLTWLAPRDMWHPNRRGPACCIGRIHPGTPLVDLVHRVYMVVTYQEVMPDEGDALNIPACAWARANLHRFPVDDRPIKRRSFEQVA